MNSELRMSEGTKRLNVSERNHPRAEEDSSRFAWTRRVSQVVLLTIFCVVVAGQAQAAGSLILIPDPKLLAVMIVAFVLLIFPLNALLFTPVFQALDARAEKIEGARARSAQLQTDADEVLARYETSIREARAESESVRQSKLEQAREEQTRLTTAARGEAERELERAREELGRSVDSARTNLRSSAEELARSAAETVLGRAL